MDNEIQEAVNVLVGLPLWGVGRASDLVWFEFGSRRTVQGTRGPKQVGDYALHVQCSWRITQGEKVVTARGDIFCSPLEDNESPVADFDWERDNRFDRVVARLFQKEPRQFQVKRIHAGEAGSLSLILEDGYN